MQVPVLLVINKIDRVKKEEILTFIDAYRGELDFAEIVPVSALKKSNTDRLIDCIFKYLPQGIPFYAIKLVTDIVGDHSTVGDISFSMREGRARLFQVLQELGDSL